jgi:hypothetical protein
MANRKEDLEEEVIEELRQHLEICRSRRSELATGGFDPQLASAAAQLSRALLAFQTERRQRERMQQKAEDALTPQAIVARLRRMDEHERAHVLAELERMSGRSKVLGR